MAIRQRLEQRQRQVIALTPGMRRSLGILRMPALTLRDELLREAAENPLLIVEEGDGRAAGLSFAADLPAVEGPRAALVAQIERRRLAPEVEAAALFLAGELREDGYLDTTLERIAEEFRLPIAPLEAGLAALQGCEPAGVGARSLAECLALQLVDRGLDRALAFGLTGRLADLAAGRWTVLARALGQPMDEIARLAELVRSLSPRPLSDPDTPSVIRVPDLVVQKTPDGGLSVALAYGVVPRLSVMDMAHAGEPGTELRKLFARARAIASAVGARGATLLAIGRLIAELQAEFFTGGERIVPLTRAEAAAALGLHPSTLGRAIADKALVFAGTVHALETFFPRPAPGPDLAVSAFDLQRRIQAIVAAEDPGQPLADEAIRTQLKIEGVDIARRTVAKYRKCLRIASSYARRRNPRPGRGPKRPDRQ
ncbi:MAG: hypothetical protein ACKVPY_12015 [Paracoccaceae bacterium]